MKTLEYIINQRGLKFVKKDMKIESLYNGKFGIIKGGNSSGNLNVLFEGDKKPSNCHPTYKMRYFDNENNIIAEYND